MKDMEDHIVLAKESDREEILALYRIQLGRPFCAWDEDYPGDHEITFDLSRNALYVLKRDGRIIAAISLEEDETVEALDCWDPALAPGGELARLCVHPDFQNEGIARRMMQYGLEELKRRGFQSVHFLVNKYNEKAIRSYAAFDYNVAGECYLYDQEFLCYEKRL